MRLAKLRKLQADGFPTNIALSKVLESEAKESSMTPQMKVEQQRLNAGEDAKFLAGQTAVGTFGKLGLWVKSLWSNEAELSKAVQVPVSTARAQGEYMTRAKDAILEEFQDLDLVSPGISRDDRYRLATAQVQKRTVQTDQGPIVLPKNTSKAAYFGIPAASSDAYLSTALSNLLKSDEAGHHRVAYNVNGRLAWQEYDQDDVRGPMQYLDNTAVQKEVQRLTDADAAKAAKLHGPGFINRAHKVPVQYNGNNSAGAAASLMMKLRDTLVDHEGLNPYVTADSTGVLTGGVGITGDYLEKHVPGYKRGTTLTPEQINESFRDASNDAAVAGTRVAQAYNLGDPGFLLASELAYHAGTKFYNQPKYKEFLTALQQKNSKAAVSAFMDTKAYAVSGKARKASYLNLVQQIVR